MRHEIVTDRPAVVERVHAGGITDVREWLRTQATTHNLRWLLAHADDGVIWGRAENGHLLTSDSVAPEVSPPLRLLTLQTARLFASHAELLLWRGDDGSWHARLVRDAKTGERADWPDVIDEAQVLWGTDCTPHAGGFTLMEDGAQGLRHVVPLTVTGTYAEWARPLRLGVRHYVLEDEGGFARIVASRLVDLKGEAR